MDFGTDEVSFPLFPLFSNAERSFLPFLP